MNEYECMVPEIELKFKSGIVKKVKIRHIKDAVKLIRENFFNSDTLELYESVVVLFLNRNNMSIGWVKHSIGGIGYSVIDVNLIVAIALKSRASNIIVAHNHPSGNVQPSPEDIFITKRLELALGFFDMRLLEHVIISDDDYHSILHDKKEKKSDE